MNLETKVFSRLGRLKILRFPLFYRASCLGSYPIRRFTSNDGPSLKTKTTSGLSTDMLISLSMNYNNDGKTHQELVTNLKRNQLVKNDRVYEVLSKVDRRDFIGISCSTPYVDKPQDIGCGATITSPHMHAIALETLLESLAPGMTALDVGSGSGYLTTCMAYLVEPNGKVAGVDHSQDLVRQSEVNVDKSHQHLLKIKRLIFKVGDGFEGLASEGPYDCIHVGAAVEAVPQALLDQLKIGGRMLIPIISPDQSGEQDLVLLKKTSATSHNKTVVMKCVYSLLETSTPELVPEVNPLDEINETIAEMTKELAGYQDEIKKWNLEYKKNNQDKKPSLKDYRRDEHISKILEKSTALTKKMERYRIKKQDILEKRTPKSST